MNNKKLGNDFEDEVWFPLEDYEGLYLISNLGRIASRHWNKHKILRQRINNKGYAIVNLCKYGLLKTFKVHSLVAKHFLPNPNKLTEINHKDENKLNNRWDNLEWCTRSHNINYGTRTSRQRLKVIKGVIQYDKNGKYIASFDSISQAGKIIGISPQHIVACCKNKYPQAGGFIWRYSSEVQNASE